MDAYLFITLLLVVFAATATDAIFFGKKKCQKIETPDDFYLEKYIEKSWYIQRQQVNTYQPKEDLSCIVATYEMEGRRSYGRSAVTVRNFANEEVNPGVLCATRKAPRRNPAQLTVAPCFFPPAFGGDYWVVAFASDYSWAIVTGGQPDVPGQCESNEDLCTTAEECPIKFLPCIGNGQGLWFFTRERSPSDEIMEEMEAKALDLGICTANMLDVVHEGCTYEGYIIKI